MFKNKEIKEKAVFVSICIVLGIILSIQFKTATYTTGKGINPRQREKELTLEYQEVLEEKERLEDMLASIDGKIKEYEEIEKEKDIGIKKLYNELEKYRMFVGFESVKGSGIVIEINDPSLNMEMGEEYSIVLANYDLILQLISKLNDLGAEAISINGERYTNYTSLEPQEKSVNSIKINDVSIRLPLEIKVIGNPEKLERGLNVRGTVMWNMQNKYLYNVKIQRKDDIIIPEYNKLLNLKYVKAVKIDNKK